MNRVKKLYYIFIMLLFFNCANAQESTDQESPLQFDNNSTVQNVGEDQLIFELEKNALGTNGAKNTTRLLSPENPNNNQNRSSGTIPSTKETKPEIATTRKNTEDSSLSKFDTWKEAILKSPIPQDQLLETTTTPARQLIPSSIPTADQPANQKKLEYVKTIYNRGEFFLLAKTVIAENEYEALYYQAIGNYNLVRKEKNYQSKLTPALAKEKSSLINTSKNNLFNVGKNTTDSDLKERAIFWYGIISFTHPNNPKDEKALTDTFLYIEENLKTSSVYNDALLYLMMIYKKRGKTDKSKEYYKKVLQTDPNDLVYDYTKDQLVPARNIVKLYNNLK